MVKDFVLKNGRKVSISELSALEDVMTYHLGGDKIDIDKNAISSAMLLRSISVALSLKSVDEVELKIPESIDDVYKLLHSFTKKEWSEIQKYHDELNGTEDEVEGE